MIKVAEMIVTCVIFEKYKDVWELRPISCLLNPWGWRKKKDTNTSAIIEEVEEGSCKHTPSKGFLSDP
uniref:Uncharacterized protein n=1 Tax=Romanomermis culicivorax TaxID=13658 RepID=A0A915KJN7_ROMCU